jgi:hypothetical protein
LTEESVDVDIDSQKKFISRKKNTPHRRGHQLVQRNLEINHIVIISLLPVRGKEMEAGKSEFF